MLVHLERVTGTALYRTYLVVAPMLVGLYWWRRRPASRFGPLLVLFGLGAWFVSWQSSDWPPAFSLGVLAESVTALLTFYLFLAFPTGRLETCTNRLLMGAWAAAILVLFVPALLMAPAITGVGALSTCAATPGQVADVPAARARGRGPRRVRRAHTRGVEAAPPVAHRRGRDLAAVRARVRRLPLLTRRARA